MHVQAFDYQLRWHARQPRQGEHDAANAGDAGVYRGDRLLRDAADVRRLALRSTVRDPFGRLWAREHMPTATIDLWVLIDLSASMLGGNSAGTSARSGGSAAATSITLASQLIESAALSAQRVGDRLGVFCAANEPKASLCVPASRLMRPALDVSRLLASETSGVRGVSGEAAVLDSAAGLAGASARIGPRQALVFLISDFNESRTNWPVILRGLAHHQLVPVVAWDIGAASIAQARGLVSVRDAETGQTRVLWMREALRKKIRMRLLGHRQQLDAMFAQHGHRAVHMFDGFDADTLTRYFHGAEDRREMPLS